MEQEFQNVTHAIDTMERLQTRHIESFQTELMPDLERQTLERQHAFKSMTDSLNIFFQQMHLYDDAQVEKMAKTITEQINRLQQQNTTLVEKVEVYKADLKARMSDITKGRQAIRSYGPSSSVTGRSRVISLTN